MSVSSICNKVFKIAIDDYHKANSVDAQNKNPFKDSLSLEKIIYDKCWIDTVQWHLEDIIRKPNIEPYEALKIKRRIATEDHRKKCSVKVNVLMEQQVNLSTAIDQLFDNISKGKVRIATYKQMKMYNDESLNPELYSQND